MGAIKPVVIDNEYATVWLTTTGQILCISKNFTDLMGFRQHEVAGKPLHAILDTTQGAQEIMDAASSMQLGEMSMDNFKLIFKNKYVHYCLVVLAFLCMEPGSGSYIILT